MPRIRILPLALSTVLFATGALVALAAPDVSPNDAAASGSTPEDGRRDEVRRVSPVLGIDRGSGPRPRPRPPRPGGPDEARSLDGSGNHLTDPEMGAAGTPLARLMAPDYSDGVSAMAGVDRPEARSISNAVCAQDASMPNALGATDYLWQWGQFVDHDIDLTDGTDPPEPAVIRVPAGDPWFDPDATGERTIALNRSIYDPLSGTDPGNPRQQMNEISAWIDGSNVYGSDEERAAALRTLDGTGRLAVSEGDLLPFNTAGLPNAGGSSDALFLAGDVRANEQVGLTTMHTLFVREHNRLAARIAEAHPAFDGDRIYEAARRIVGAEIQSITYDEYLPALLGPGAIRPYDGYRPAVDGRILNLFSTAAYRYGHSALSPTLLRLDAQGHAIADGHLALRDAFFSPQRITDEGGIEPVLRGLAAQRCQRVDARLVDDVRNFLFGPPGSGGFDLASLNLQRGRDHGLPGYNDVREVLGMPRAESFDRIGNDATVQAALASVYDDVDDVDLWVGGLAETPVPGSHLGPVFHTIVKRQFEALRDADRFWYREALRPDERDLVENTRLADVIRRNTTIGDELPQNVFRVGTGPSSGPGPGGGQPAP